ncbi:MAG: carboxy terminal-processing peptidase [Bacteroidia bacterium]|nr:carboxy terminal-processing peptidase [Bacteroidia bacterium]NNF32175.1 carboxy terminal-processing peptidase [Flavobacteriaceae bacterium]MBT8276638.1 carboxy terminal-processing peptidase [Bacteroidia bacterium]NNJ82892.1 carboxy terminal-processing peptidase [Flavobacteriaceae bacterium]NNK55096.1 carboxy terminal-processing peptidase [Flavobacteriaceae bacterium]
MKKNLKVLFLAIFVAAASCSFTTKEFEDPDKDKLLIDLITYVLQKGHYNPADMDDTFSAGVYEDFIEAMDPLKRYFLASDVEEFSVYRDEIDNQIKEKDLTFFNLVYSRYMERLDEARDRYKVVLKTPFDYSEDETINVDYDNLEYASSKKELKERWRQQLKFSGISAYYDLMQDKLDSEERKKEAATSGEEYVPGENDNLSAKELEEKAREQTRTSLNEYFEFTDDLERKDYFAVFLTTVVEEFDPHTNYFAPPDRDRFDLRMSGKLEGIGARLQKKNDYINVVEIISGGPAWRGEHIEVGDIIMKVRQADEDESVSVVGMRLDDAVKLIKGPKGTKVTLTIKRVDGTIEEETITRDVVELEETYAKSTVIEKEKNKFGLINLPQFYFDMNDYKKRNAASDVKEEIIRLKQEGVEGLVLDLRDNGGGSLRTAVDIAGLFIKDGPVVQVASTGSKKEVLKDRDDEIIWDGPLVILVNELSASASEILAAAMQDYKRAIIIGSTQTYGKGTVQNLIDLNQWLRKNDLGDMGALKLTTQKFYRVNGGSTQLEGVKSDVIMPDRYSYIEVGERDYDNPLPYDKIEPAKYKIWEGYIDFEETIKKSKERMAKSEQLALIEENARWIKNRREEMVVDLNYERYNSGIERRKSETKKFDAIGEYDNKLSYRSLPFELELMKQDTTLREKRKRWHKSLSKDIYVEEAVNVLQDLKLNNIKAGKLAEIKN